ncbi:hypothetical protein [Haloferax profundi]|uniref:hypothetical protein n=1 Tax=Haloferax profundi TaxID=1544718 RepID=UPI000ADA33C3|nr:hypothetical protein [Haloferax profundi]
MATSSSRPTSRCLRCGFSAVSGGDEWDRVEASLGTMTQCPECGSTNVMTGR